MKTLCSVMQMIKRKMNQEYKLTDIEILFFFFNF